MSSTADLLRSVSRSVEAEIQPRLHGLFGGMVRAYLPQTWVFRTEQGVASLVVDRGGHTSVVEAAAPQPDVTVEVGHDRLKGALATPRRNEPSAGPLTVTPHTAKGRAAFDLLRSRIGL